MTTALKVAFVSTNATITTNRTRVYSAMFSNYSASATEFWMAMNASAAAERLIQTRIPNENIGHLDFGEAGVLFPNGLWIRVPTSGTITVAYD